MGRIKVEEYVSKVEQNDGKRAQTETESILKAKIVRLYLESAGELSTP